jgi:hypothetical protein
VCRLPSPGVELAILVSPWDLISLTLNWRFADLGELCMYKRGEGQTLLIAPDLCRSWSAQA